MKKTLLTLVISGALLTPLRAPSAEISDFRRGLATVILCGVGGAVLGLSTLSFYDERQEHLSNITMGMALGVVGGTIYVLSSGSSEPSAWFEPPKNIPSNPYQAVKIGQPTLKLSWNF